MTGEAGNVQGAEHTIDEASRASAMAGAARVRRLGWRALPVVAVLYVLVLYSRIDPGPRLLILEALYMTPIVIVVVIGLRLMSKSGGTQATFWGSLALANTVLFSCELLLIYWVFVIDPAGPPRVSWPFHIMHAFAAVAFIRMLVSMSTMSRVKGAVRARWTIDIVSVTVVVALLLSALYVRPIMEPRGASMAEVLLGVGYPLFGISMLLGTLAHVVGFKASRWRPWDRLVAISLSIYAVAISLWPLWFTTAEATSRNYERGVLDVIQLSGHWLLMMAAVHRATDAEPWELEPLPLMAWRRKVKLETVVPTMLVVATPLLGWLAFRAAEDARWSVMYAAAATGLVGLALARSLVVAVENGSLLHRSITDPVTGLYNHRFFHEQLGEAVDRARRFGLPLCVIALDLREFAEYNRVHGHASGDRLLLGVGNVLLDASPGECIVSRLSGDQFGVIAPDVSLLDARVLARRLVDVASIAAGPEPGSVALAAGVAAFPEHGSDAESLARSMLGALFNAKQDTNDPVAVFDERRMPDLTASERIERLDDERRAAAATALAATLGMGDPAAGAHGRRVSRTSALICEQLGLDGTVCRLAETAGLLHDIGGRAHGDVGSGRSYRRREPVAHLLGEAGLPEVTPIVACLGERFDGSGGPQGLAGDEIPLASRIVTVAAAFDDATGAAEHAPGRSARALDALESASGTAFDPLVVAALRAVLA